MQLKSCKKDSQVFHDSQHFPLLDLPVGLLCDIFSRLPLRSILQCKLVCKMSLELLKDPYFIDVHFARAAISTTINLVIPEYHPVLGIFRLFAFDHSEMASSSSSTDLELFNYRPNKRSPSQDSIAEIVYQTKSVALVGSCNGLLCFMVVPSGLSFQKLSFHICNPILSEFVKIPSIHGIPAVNTYYPNTYGFGYCPGTKQYKVVCVIPMSSSVPSTGQTVMLNTHTLGSDSWRTTYQDIPFIVRMAFDPFLNGHLHWITKSTDPSKLIAAFDLEKEMFWYVPLPDHFTREYATKATWINVGVLRNNLCLCYIYKDSEFEVWVMKEYGVKESWEKEFSLDRGFYCELHVEDLNKPIKFLSNGDLLFLSRSNCLVSFSPRKRTFRELKYMGVEKSLVEAHDLSLISLKDVMGAKKHEVKTQQLRKLRFKIDKNF